MKYGLEVDRIVQEILEFFPPAIIVGLFNVWNDEELTIDEPTRGTLP
jgi:hypothetical protein